ncbi:37728_t:CDS:2 [Gigaspora margarita]|uniref:37728_t:CDS:1 n=1 Tax=Gigaspora margarita TaxID=4874 RepID=A0ABN7UZW3_GIGMA|nr:37728_t:CDS:2 [Gigaspora margarita]
MCMNPLYQVNVSLFTVRIKYPTSRCYNIVSNADDFVIKLNQNEFRAVSASPDSDLLSNPHRRNMEISNNAVTCKK